MDYKLYKFSVQDMQNCETIAMFTKRITLSSEANT